MYPKFNYSKNITYKERVAIENVSKLFSSSLTCINNRSKELTMLSTMFIPQQKKLLAHQNEWIPHTITLLIVSSHQWNLPLRNTISSIIH
jgi:hypothetical protein